MVKHINHLKLIFCALPLVMQTACDTSDDGVFIVGSEPKESEFLNVDQAQLTFAPEGDTYQIKITSIASWEVTMANNNAGQFSVTPTSGKGDGVVTVTAKANPTAVSYTADLQIRPLNFDMEPVSVVLRQTNTTFSIDSYPSSETTPEEGGLLNMTAYSSLSWVLEVVEHDADHNMGNPDWLTITPGLAGGGKEGNAAQEFRFTWKPNYTNQDRTIRFQFKPSSSELQLTELPRPFTLVQSAGSVPQSVRCVVENLDIVNAKVSLEYSSRSPIKDCGIYLYKVVSDGDNELVDTYRPATAGDEYDKNGFYSIAIPELIEDTKYQLVPFCINEVAEVKGDSRDITTGIKPENMMYDGVEIVKADNGGVSIETDTESATLTINVISDVEPLGADRIASAVLAINGTDIHGTATSFGENAWRYVFKANDLVSNSQYDYSIVVTSNELPRAQGQMRNKTDAVSGTLKTKGKTPGENDNDKPTVGE